MKLYVDDNDHHLRFRDDNKGLSADLGEIKLDTWYNVIVTLRSAAQETYPDSFVYDIYVNGKKLHVQETIMMDHFGMFLLWVVICLKEEKMIFNIQCTEQ